MPQATVPLFPPAQAWEKPDCSGTARSTSLCLGRRPCQFFPTNPLEIALLEYLLKKHDRVSWELVVSGMGLINIHDFMLNHYGEAAPEWLAGEMAEGDAAAAISKAALSPVVHCA